MSVTLLKKQEGRDRSHLDDTTSQVRHLRVFAESAQRLARQLGTTRHLWRRQLEQRHEARALHDRLEDRVAVSHRQMPERPRSMLLHSHTLSDRLEQLNAWQAAAFTC